MKMSAILLFFILKSLSTDGAMFCYHGGDVNTLGALKNETCSTKELHIPKSMMSDEQQTSMTPFEQMAAGVNSRTMSQVPSVPLCYIYRHISTTIYASGIRQESVSIIFGCDLGHVCNNRELNKVLYNATRQLYCCHGDNCNSVDKLPQIASDNQICYHGTNNVSGSPTAEVHSCSQPDVSCARRTTFLSQGKIEDFFCDNGRSCLEHRSSGAYHSCSNTTVDNATQELCCCNENKCFVPHWPPPMASDGGNNTISPVKHPSLEPMGTTINKPGEKSRSAALITGVIAAVVIMAGFAAAVIFVGACKRRKTHRRDPNVIMQYERLSVSDAEMEDAVVL